MLKLQVHMLQLLKEVDQICRRHDIQYYLIGGSLIGAVRHHGFIPWDDDSDVIMTRENWEKFYKYASKELPEGRRISTQYSDLSCAMTINRYSETETTGIFRYHITNPEVAGNQIDVFIMDPVPDDEEAKKEYALAVAKHMELTSLHFQYAMRVGQPTEFTKYYKMSKEIGKRRALEEIDKKAFHYTEEESAFYAQRFAGSVHFWPKEAFGEPKYMPFEDTMLPVPERYHEVLTIGYNDEWMMIPRSGPNRSTHDFTVRSFTYPYSIIAADFESHIDRKKMMSLFIRRKFLWEKVMPDKLSVENEACQLQVLSVSYKYKKRLEGIDLELLLNTGDFDTLRELFNDYISVQNDGEISGSSSLTGWKQWYRKNHPCFIDIGDDAFYAVLRLLEHDQKPALLRKFLRARKTIKRPLTDGLKQMDDFYQILYKAHSAYYADKYEECRELILSGQEIFPEDPALAILSFKMDVSAMTDQDEIIDKADRLLAVYPGHEELLIIKADALLDKGLREDALAILRQLMNTSNHGIVLQHVNDMIKALAKEDKDDKSLQLLAYQIRVHLGATEEELRPLREELHKKGILVDESETEEMNASLLESAPILAKRFELLKELDEVCRRNDIEYFLRGRVLLQAVRFGRFVDKNTPVTAFMSADNVDKFIKAVKKMKGRKRFIESIATNSDFYKMAVRYGAGDTLQIHAGSCATESPFGIYITIEVLRKEPDSKLLRGYRHLLELGMESDHELIETGKKARISKLYFNSMKKLIGKKRAQRHVYHQLMAEDNNNGAYYNKFYQKDRNFFPKYLFDFSTDIYLEGHEFKTALFFERLLRAEYGGDWKDMDVHESSSSTSIRATATDLSGKEFVDYLDSIGFDREGLNRRWRKVADDYIPIKEISKKVAFYWDMMVASGARFRLYEMYSPIKDELMELYRKHDYEELFKELNEFYVIVSHLRRKKIGLSFDKDIDQMLVYCMYSTGRIKEADSYLKLIRKQNWKPVCTVLKEAGR